jgi:hypothetical protein
VTRSQSRGRNSDRGSTGSIFPPQIQNPSISGSRLREGIPLEVGTAEPEASLEGVPGNVTEEVNSLAKRSVSVGARILIFFGFNPKTIPELGKL